MTVVGVVGLGAMGKPIAARLADAGFDVVGHDRHHHSTSLADVAAADIVFVVVPTDDDVSTVVTALVPDMRPGAVVAISASVHPSTCVALASYAAERGVDVLDVALTGGIRGAETGTLNLLVGGDRAVVERQREVFAAIAANYHVLGPVGAGQIGKASSNLIHWAEIVAIEEALRMADGLGVAPSALRAALQEGGTDSRTLRELELMHFTWYAKDLAIAHDLAAQIGLELPVARLSGDLMPAITPESIRSLLAPNGTTSGK
jgi:3-hydroxyisobutyrate dehydrogenase-like beta-hydroxyacid dehydrogenase